MTKGRKRKKTQRILRAKLAAHRAKQVPQRLRELVDESLPHHHVMDLFAKLYSNDAEVENLVAIGELPLHSIERQSWIRGQLIIGQTDHRLIDSIGDLSSSQFPAMRGWSKHRYRLVGFEPPEDITDDSYLMAATLCAFKSRTLSQTPNWIEPTPDLMALLDTTTLEKIYPTDVRFPFPAFYVELGPDEVVLLEPHDVPYDVRMIGVTQCREYDSSGFLDAILVVLRGYRRDGFPGPKEVIETVFVPLFPSDRDLEHGTESLLAVRKRVLAILRQDHPEIDPEDALLYNEALRGSVYGYDYEGDDFRKKVGALCINLILYMNSRQADIVDLNKARIERLLGGKPIEKLPRKQQEVIFELQRSINWSIGTTVMIDPAVCPRHSGGTTGTGRPLLRQSIVRGHWRWQAHGPRWSLRRLQWIHAHVRKKDLPTPNLGHEYKLRVS